MTAPPPAAGRLLPGDDFAPGTNRRGGLSRADWRFLLPALDAGRVLFLGVPAAEELAVLAGSARAVAIAAPDPGPPEEGPAGVARLRATAHRLPLADAACDLVVVRDRGELRRLLGAPAATAEVARVLAPGGTLYVEAAGWLDAARARRWAARLAEHGLRPPRVSQLVRRRGELRLALPPGDRDVARFLVGGVLAGTSRRARTAGRVGSRLAGLGLLRPLLPGRGLVVQRPRPGEDASVRSDGPGAWLAAVAPPGAAGEVARAGARTAFFRGGGFDSNKAVFFLFEPGRRAPSVVVKTTRSPRYNGRLETEFRSLALVRARGLAAPGTYPDPLFLGEHAGLAVLAQRPIAGIPFREGTRADASCPYARAALGWIERLGAGSADARAASRAEAGGWLRALLEHVARLYALTEAERAFLAERVAAVEDARGAFPLVLQHGDAGTWNVRVDGTGGVAFLDWEASRPAGMPLWDLLDFLQSFASWCGRVRGGRDRVAAYAAALLAPTPLARLQADAVRRYCAEVGVDRALVEPLFYACWMQRAAREAAWNPRAARDGFYRGLLRLCIGERDAEGLRWTLG